MAKLTTKQLTDLVSKLTNQSVELVENDTDSDYNEDTLLSAVDGTRTPIIRQLLKTEIHGEASRKVNDAYRKSISSKFGVPLADLNGLESDAILEKAIEHYRLNTTDTEKSQQKKIDEILKAHSDEVTRITSDWEKKHNEVTGQLTRKSLVDVLAKAHKNATGLPVDMNKDKAAEAFLSELERKGVLKLNEDGSDIEIYDRNDPSTRLLNSSKTANITVNDFLKGHYTELGLWKDNTSDVNALTAASKAASLSTTANTPAPSGKSPHAQMETLKSMYKD
jgi:hypothetical protein